MEPLHVRLNAAAVRWSGQPVSLRRMAGVHGPSAHAALLVLLAVPCMLPIPGAGTVLSLGLLMLAWMMWQDRTRLVLPWRIGRWQLPAAGAQRTLRALAWVYAYAGRFSCERWTVLVHPRQRFWMAPMVATMAVLIFLPIPFGNVLPALALVNLGMGLMFRDGFLVLLGAAMAAASVAVVGLLGATAFELGSALLLHQLKP